MVVLILSRYLGPWTTEVFVLEWFLGQKILFSANFNKTNFKSLVAVNCLSCWMKLELHVSKSLKDKTASSRTILCFLHWSKCHSYLKIKLVIVSPFLSIEMCQIVNMPKMMWWALISIFMPVLPFKSVRLSSNGFVLPSQIVIKSWVLDVSYPWPTVNRYSTSYKMCFDPEPVKSCNCAMPFIS